MASLLNPGQRIAGYEILQQVGKGGMGEVYKAKQVSMDRIVALKILSPKLVAKDPAFTERFIAEARAAGRLNHPNIVGVHDVGQTTLKLPDETTIPIHYFSMEFVEGETIKDVIERQDRVPLAECATIAKAMGEALVYAESQRVVHRDIKPENIMIAAGGVVKLADLGLAEQVSDDAVDDPDPKARKVMGTPMYMSPEQARGLTVGHACDQYSLGATLFHMLTGRAPFVGKDAKGLMRSHVLDPVPDPHEAASDVPESWRELCMRLMAKLPEERFSNATDLRVAIASAIAGETSISRRTKIPRTTTGVGPSRRMPSSSSNIGLVIAGSVVVAAVGGWFVFGRGGSSAQKETPSEPIVEQPKTDESLLAAKRLVGGLGSDDAAAIVALDQALADGSLSSAGRAVLQEERNKRDATLTQQREALVAEQRKQLDGLADLIKKRRFDQAQRGIAAFQGQVSDGEAQKRLAQLQADFAAAVTAMHADLLAAVPKSDHDGIVKLEADAGGLPVSDERRQAFEAAVAARKGQLDAEAAAKAAKDAEEPRWRDLARALDQNRYSALYANARAALTKASADFPTEDLRNQTARVVELAELAQQVEGYMRAYVKSKSPAATLRIDGTLRKVALYSLDDDTIQVRPTGAGMVKLARTDVSLDWKKMLNDSLAICPADIRRQGPRFELAFAAFWDPTWATEAAAALGDDPLAVVYRLMDQRRPWPRLRNGNVVRDGRVHIGYDFVPGDERLWNDFSAKGLSSGEFGLIWQPVTAVPRAEMSEDKMEALEWRARLLPPCTFKVNMRINHNTMVSMCGVEIDGKRYRAAVNTNAAKSAHTGSITTDNNGGIAIGSGTQATLDFSTPITFEATVTDNQKLTLKIDGNTIERDLDVGKGAVGLVIQILQFKAGGSVEIENISADGARLVGLPNP